MSDLEIGADGRRRCGWCAGDVERLMGNPGIVRNQKKIEASVNNARAFLKIAGEYGSFGQWLLGFFEGEPLVNRPENPEDIPVTSALAQRAAKTMKKRGGGGSSSARSLPIATCRPWDLLTTI